MDVGILLRRTRERQRLTLAQLADTTKIHTATLTALENNDIDRLPANVYTRGFIRAYAREVGLDPDETAAQYLAQFKETPEMMMAEAEKQEGAAEAPRMALFTPAAAAFNPRNIPAPVLAGVVVVLLVVSYFALAPRVSGNPQAHAPAAEASTPAGEVARAASSAPAGPDATAAMTADTLRVELAASGPSWVSASADRAAAANRLMQAGERQTIEARDELVLRVGDPATLDLSINGVPARPLGRPGQPVTVQITKENFRSFLQS